MARTKKMKPSVKSQDSVQTFKDARQTALEACSKEVGAVLDKYGFNMEIQHTIAIVPKK